MQCSQRLCGSFLLPQDGDVNAVTAIGYQTAIVGIKAATLASRRQSID
jgi:hypothetical protein